MDLHEDGSAFFECELPVASVSELELSGLWFSYVSSIESMKEQSTTSNLSSNMVVNEGSNSVQSESQSADVSVSCSWYPVLNSSLNSQSPANGTNLVHC